MYKSTRLFVDLLLHSDEHSLVLFEVLRQLLDKPDPEKYEKIVLENSERKLVHFLENIYVKWRGECYVNIRLRISLE